MKAATLLCLSVVGYAADVELDQMADLLQERQLDSASAADSQLDESLSAKHGHRPHGHNPHFHAPHWHNPHWHNPHAHNPHAHNPHSHNPHVHTPYPTRYPTPYPTRYPTPNPTPFPTRYPTPYPTPYPTNYPTPHPCVSGSHGCDKNAGGICYQMGGNSWGCNCKTGYWCSKGCSQPHTSHTCTVVTPSPTPYPTPNPTPYPTPAPTPNPTPYPTHAPTPYACAKTTCSYTQHTRADGTQFYRTDVFSHSGSDTEPFACERVAGTTDCVCLCGESGFGCKLTHHGALGEKTISTTHC